MPPSTQRRRELWLQHAAGFVLFRDVRGYAVDQIDPDLSAESRAAALKAIDDALYGLMMVIDGVTGGLQNQELAINLKVAVHLRRLAPAEFTDPVAEVDLSKGDGMCMGYHGWLEGDFGKDPVVVSGAQHGAG